MNVTNTAARNAEHNTIVLARIEALYVQLESGGYTRTDRKHMRAEIAALRATLR